MVFDDDFDIPKGNFISGIYNYCDRWCERCIYTDKCMNFATGKQIRLEIEKNKKREKSIEENKIFWDQVNKSIEDAADLIDEEIPLMKNDKNLISKDWEDDEETTETMKENEEKRNKAKNHILSKWASKYEQDTRIWFEDIKDTLIQDYNSDTNDFAIRYQGIDDNLVLIQLSESVEVILWYHIQIWIKIQRALNSNNDEQENGDYLEGFPKDSEGSAMVAIKGIKRSIGAWSYLLGKLVPEQEAIRPIIRMLIKLKMELEKLFPKANEFEWPPKH